MKEADAATIGDMKSELVASGRIDDTKGDVALIELPEVGRIQGPNWQRSLEATLRNNHNHTYPMYIRRCCGAVTKPVEAIFLA